GMGESGIRPQSIIVALLSAGQNFAGPLRFLSRFCRLLKAGKARFDNTNTDPYGRAGCYSDVGPFPKRSGAGGRTTMSSPSTVLMIDDSPMLPDVLRPCFARDALTLHFA